MRCSGSKKDNDSERFVKALAMILAARFTYKEVIRAEDLAE